MFNKRIVAAGRFSFFVRGSFPLVQLKGHLLLPWPPRWENRVKPDAYFINKSRGVAAFFPPLSCKEGLFPDELVYYNFFPLCVTKRDLRFNAPH